MWLFGNTRRSHHEKIFPEKVEFDKEKLLVTSLIKSSALLIFIAAPNAILAYRDRPV